MGEEVKKCIACGSDFPAFDEIILDGKLFEVCPNCGIIKLKK